MVICYQAAGTTEQIRNKYNTLTPAEAKKLNKLFLTQSVGGDRSSQPHAANLQPHLYTMRQPPVRTASVLHKPRAPPIVVTNLDATIEQLTQSYCGVNTYSSSASLQQPMCSTDITASRPPEVNLNRSTSIRSASVGPVVNGRDCRRHTINYGRASTLNGRNSVYTIAATPTTSRNTGTVCSGDHCGSTRQTQQLHMNESISNLSFKSSLDTTDYAHDSNRLQTMSVDLGSTCHSVVGGRPLTVKTHQDPVLKSHTIARLKYNTINNSNSRLFSDESYSSARSNLSLRPVSITPTESRSASKTSLSTSTYKVFQTPFANFKKLFRNIPRPFSSGNQDARTDSNYNDSNKCAGAARRSPTQLDLSYQSDKTTVGDISISGSMSRLSLNKSQSPPVCPPPPGELKSMCYMESAVNYSNYDDFTRMRNEQTARKQAEKLAQNALTMARHKDEHPGSRPNADSDTDSWQLTSLPVYYERNLTTLFEEKQASGKVGEDRNFTTDNISNSTNRGHQLIKPPTNFDDNNQISQPFSGNLTDDQKSQVIKLNSSCQSLASSKTLDPALDFQQRQQQLQQQLNISVGPANPYRFSFAQPVPPHMNQDQVTFQKNLGLPPRMPGPNSETQSNNSARQGNSSSGNSSNCSLQLNGINTCDRPNSLETASDDKNSYVSDESTGYGNLNGLSNSADVTILSETSTLQGETGVAYYANRCNELERTVTTLKNKLINKEKELTDLQLSQLNNDYTIERLRKQVNKLERENAQLKTMVAKS